MKNTRCVFKMHNYTTLLNNEVKYNPYTWAEWAVAGAGSTKGASGIHLVEVDGAESAIFVIAVLPSTKYLLLYKVLASTLDNDFNMSATSFVGATTVLTKEIGNNKSILTSAASIVDNQIRLQCNSSNTNGTYIDFNSVRLIKCPTGSQISTDADTLTADQLNTKYPYASFPNTIVMDRSRFLNNGTLSGGAVYKLLPAPLYVLDFTNPTSLVTIPKSANINDLAQITVRGWFYYGGAGGSNSGRIFSKTNKILYLDSTNNRLTFSHVFSTTTGIWDTPTSGLVAGNYYQYQITYDNSATANNPVVMIDGVSKTVTRTQAPVGTASADNASDLILGNLAAGNRSLNGYLSEIEIFQGILSVAEGKRFYNATYGKYGKVRVL